MKRRRTRNGPYTSRDSSNGESDNMMKVLHGMMETQHQQTKLLRQALLIALRKQRHGNVSDFRRPQPATFSGTKRSLDAEQWLIDTTYLLKAARIPNENQVKVAKIQLKDVARTWWLAEKQGWRSPSLGISSRRVSTRDSSLRQHRRRWKNNLSDCSRGTKP